MTYEDIINQLGTLYDRGEAKAIARLLLEEGYGLSVTDILCGKVNELSSDCQQDLRKKVARLTKAEPIQYVLGTTIFCGRRLTVGPGVLIPRPETEELCRWVISMESTRLCNEGKVAPTVLDIGTGSGCIAITLAAELQGSRVTAWDISDRALSIARENTRRCEADVRLFRQDVLEACVDDTKACEDGLWDVIVSNPPYIYRSEAHQMARNVLDYEPDEALFAPNDAPDAMYEAIGRYAALTLRHGGSLYLEMNPLLTKQVATYLQDLGLEQVELHHDQYGKQRFVRSVKTRIIRHERSN